MARIEAILFAASAPVTRDVLSKVVGDSCSVDLLVDDIVVELAGRPYEVVRVAGGWQFRTKASYAGTIAEVFGAPASSVRLSDREALVLASVAYNQPITRQGLAEIIGVEVSRDLIGRLRQLGLVAAGPRSPSPGSPYTLVTTSGFLSHFGLHDLSDLPDLEALQDSGLALDGYLDGTAVPIGRVRDTEDDGWF